MLMYAFDADVRVWLTRTYKRRRFPGTISFFATIWGQGTNAIMQLCSGCNKGWHTTCFQIPPREWVYEANKCWCTHLIDTSLYTEAFIRNKVHWQRCGNKEPTQLCNFAAVAMKDGIPHVFKTYRGRSWLRETNADVRIKCWCTHKTLIYAFDWHERINGDVYPVR